MNAYLIRVWDDYASSMGDWDNAAIALTLEAAKTEQARLHTKNPKTKTNVTPLRLV